DVEAERAVAAELKRSDFHLGRGWQTGHRLTAEQRDSFLRHAFGDDSAMVAIISDLLSRWEATGWQIDYAPDWPYRFVDLEGEFSIDVAESTGLDWFEFDLGAVIDGERINLLPALGPLFARLGAAANRSSLAEALAELARGGAKVVIGLADGRRGRLPVARLLPLLTTLVELLAGSELTKAGRVRLPRLRAAELAALEGTAFEAARLRWLGGDRLRELGRRLADFTAIAPVDPPGGFRGELRGYQRDGLAWLQFLRAYQLNGILADDMGLGKTVQTLCHLLLEKAGGRADRPSLVVAPTSLIPNWRLEAERFAPELRVAAWHGPDRAEVDVTKADLVLTSYALLTRDRGFLAQKPWHVVVLDEAQAIKNPQAIAAQVVQMLDARHRLCLTGTPLENHLGELWSLMHFLNPGLLGDRTRFGRDFRHPIEKRGDAARRDALIRRVRPFLLRRTKDAVERDLPAKTEIVERLELEPHQRDVYESVRLAAYGRVREEIAAKGLARSHIVVLDALLKLRQVCCDPRLLRLERGAKGAGSAKLARLMEMLPALLEEGRRVLVFSQFTSMLALIESALSEADIDYLLLTGETVDRTTPVKRFQAGEVPVFLISLKAGGVGLNLTAADTVILYDPWWNPAVEAQAIDRAHRIGQDKSVFAYRLLTIGTVEEKMLELQGRKRALAEALLSGSPTAASQITEADLDTLFAPLGGAAVG
ncbi:MAG: DEAD/DEAH box helicase, partial [Alphaproteobacteria bacterium]|nr:DEAD/DEAH box helicase [Alphaproteobacteria bacterium]